MMAENRAPQHLPKTLQSELQVLTSKYSDTLSKDEALDFAIQAAELHMKFLRLATDKKEKTALGEKCKSLLSEAEQIKKSDVWDPLASPLLQYKALQPIIKHHGTTKKAVSTPAPLKKSHADSSKRNPPKEAVSTPAPLEQSLADSSKPNTPKPTTKFGKLVAPVSTRIPSTGEAIILLKSSKMNGCVFPAFQDTPNVDGEDKGQVEEIYEDLVKIPMSADQLDILEGWKRPTEALPPPTWPAVELADQLVESAAQPLMQPSRSVDLVQDAATDCSVVASLSAAIARADHGFGDILSTAIYPFDEVNGHPRASSNGKYEIRLNFNGCSRKVVIDDRLPVSKTSRILHVVDRNNPNLLWPALLEKAYLKVRGGYDFPGSNSGTDLWVLTGWIPEQIFLQHEQTNMPSLWTKMLKAFRCGDVLITLGTGAMTPKSESDLGLAGDHDYAVINLDDSFGGRRLLIKNPWLKATEWKDYHIRSTESENLVAQTELDVEMTPDGTSLGVVAPQSQAEKKTVQSSARENLNPGTFWMDMSDVMQNFDFLYLNWNPGLHKHRQDIHFSWDLTNGPTSARSCPGSLLSNPQFTLKSAERDLVWILICKHFTDKSSGGTSRETQGYISMSVFLSNGGRVLLSKGYLEHSPYVDSLQTLLPVEVDPTYPTTIAISEQDLPSKAHTFTLSVFSQFPVTLAPATPRFSAKTCIRGSWTLANAGGNANSERYSQNPQFALKIASASALCLTLETLSPGVKVHVKLLAGQGQRVYSVTKRDIIVDSGDYGHGIAIAETNFVIPAGTYTVVCSTFDTDQLGDFKLEVSGESLLTLTAIPKEGAGRIRVQLADASFRAGAHLLASPMIPRRLTNVYFTARYLPVVPSTATQIERNEAMLVSHSPIRLTVEIGRDPERHVLVASGGGMYSDSATGVRTEDVGLRPGMTEGVDIWLMLERLGGFDRVGRTEERVTVDVWADTEQPIEFGVWREFSRGW